MTCDTNKIDSNITGLAFAEESCIKVLPGTGGADAVWYGIEPNGYSDFGADVKKVARSPLSSNRQKRKSLVTDIDVTGSFSMDITQTNLTRLMQGFMFADAREMPSTKGLNSTAIEIDSVDATSYEYRTSTGDLSGFVATMLVLAKNFDNAGNNGIRAVSAVASGYIRFVSGLTDETPSGTPSIEAIGYQLPTSDCDMVVVDGIASLTTTVFNFSTKPNFVPGSWIFVGGDSSTHKFETAGSNVGFARIYSVEEHSLTFDIISFTAANETGTSKNIRLFVGTCIRNELTTNIVRRSYNFERQLGSGPTATQAEYIEGAVASELTITIPESDKVTADLKFMACDHTFRTGESGDEIKAGTRISLANEDAYNSTSNLYMATLSILDPDALLPFQDFGYVSEAKITVNNNISVNKALGVLGGFDTTAGDFEVTGSATVYFTTIEAVKAVREDATACLTIACAKNNYGFIVDVPAIGLGSGKLSIEKDQPIKLPFDTMAFESNQGHTAMYQMFKYLPDIAMPA